MVFNTSIKGDVDLNNQFHLPHSKLWYSIVAGFPIRYAPKA